MLKYDLKVFDTDYGTADANIIVETPSFRSRILYNNFGSKLLLEAYRWNFRTRGIGADLALEGEAVGAGSRMGQDSVPAVVPPSTSSWIGNELELNVKTWRLSAEVTARSTRLSVLVKPSGLAGSRNRSVVLAQEVVFAPTGIAHETVFRLTLTANIVVAAKGHTHANCHHQNY